MAARERRLVFGEDADLYDAARPSYPDTVMGEIVDLVGEGGRAVDVGCGTGKALRRLAHHGFTGVGVEAHPAMAEVARRRLPASPPWRVDTSGFEDWQPRPGDTPADLVTSAQAWHWIDPEVRLVKAHGLLRPGGWLAVFWNFSGDDNDTPVDRALAAAFGLQDRVRNGRLERRGKFRHRLCRVVDFLENAFEILLQRAGDLLDLSSAVEKDVARSCILEQGKKQVFERYEFMLMLYGLVDRKA